jgi:hypothetical protein
MFKQLFGLVLIFLLAVSCSGFVCAGKDPGDNAWIRIDADWRVVQDFKFTDLTTGESIWKHSVAAGDGHTFNFNSDKYVGHQLNIYVVSNGDTRPYWLNITINDYRGGNVDAFVKLKYNWRQCHLDMSWGKLLVDGVDYR